MTTVTQNAGEESAECPAAQLLGDDNPRLDTIRWFRVEALAGNVAGRMIIDLYNKNRKEMSATLEKNPTLKRVAKIALGFLIPAMGLFLK